jgi:hypothetical protein
MNPMIKRLSDEIFIKGDLVYVTGYFKSKHVGIVIGPAYQIDEGFYNVFVSGRVTCHEADFLEKICR